MPRPGPRPYECVRRAWHSERHQPMRGLIIQQIFRLVHDNHSAATKKNKEWQEKLPVVVLKAEEIMYSKANSEAEYSNFETLWDRVNDAIDTIIRKDETTESGEFLPPCVEAALNLGCVPVRASRSQRHNNQRTYLRPSYQECSDLSTKFLNENVNEHSSDMIPTPTSNSSMLKITQNVDSPRLVWKCSKQIPPKINQQIASSFEKPHSIVNRNSTEVDCNSSLNRHSVYPLYYGSSFGPEGSQLGFREPAKTDSIIIGVPIFSTMPAPAEGGCLQNLFPYHENRSVAKETGETIAKVNKGKEPDIGFDLSLRLGPFPDSGSSMEKVSGCVTDNVGRVFHDEGLPREEFSFFPMEPACNSISLQQSKWSAEREKKNAELVSRTHKPPYVGDVENNRFFWSQDSTSNPFPGQMRRPGL